MLYKATPQHEMAKIYGEPASLGRAFKDFYTYQQSNKDTYTHDKLISIATQLPGERSGQDIHGKT